MNVADNLLKNTNDKRKKDAFENVTFINSLRQPPNLLRQLTNSGFIQKRDELVQAGLFKCNDKRCKICRLYLQECTSFITSNKTDWNIKCYIDCNSVNVIYHLKCNYCNDTTYTGKTDTLRLRTNNHISACRNGNSTNMFDIHVHNCAAQKN